MTSKRPWWDFIMVSSRWPRVSMEHGGLVAWWNGCYQLPRAFYFITMVYWIYSWTSLMRVRHGRHEMRRVYDELSHPKRLWWMVWSVALQCFRSCWHFSQSSCRLFSFLHCKILRSLNCPRRHSSDHDIWSRRHSSDHDIWSWSVPDEHLYHGTWSFSCMIRYFLLSVLGTWGNKRPCSIDTCSSRTDHVQIPSWSLEWRHGWFNDISILWCKKRKGWMKSQEKSVNLCCVIKHP